MPIFASIALSLTGLSIGVPLGMAAAGGLLLAGGAMQMGMGRMVGGRM